MSFCFPVLKMRKEWSPENFAAVGNYILSSSSFNLVIEGSRKEKLLAQEIINILFGKTELQTLPAKHL